MSPAWVSSVRLWARCCSRACRRYLNAGPTDPATSTFPFNENMPLRNHSAVINDVPGAIAIQDAIVRIEWVGQSSNPVAFAPYLRKSPLAGMQPRPVTFSFAKGDQSAANPTTTAILRAGALADPATYVRNDFAFAANTAIGKNPHAFLFNFSAAGIGSALAAQQQVATFLASDGALVIDPDGGAALFETPIAGPQPEDLSFIP
jgi:hypothetical protein